MFSGAPKCDNRRITHDRRASGRLATFVLAGVMIVISLAGCNYTPPIDAKLETSPAVEPLPITLGVYYPPELRDFHRSHNMGGSTGITIEYFLGPPSISLFDQVLAGMFTRTVPVTVDPARLSGNPDVAAVIVLRIDRFQPYYSAGNVSPIEFIHEAIVYRATLFSPEGHPFADWTVRGLASDNFSASPSGTPAGDVVAMAMREAAAKFVAGFRQQPEVAKWLADLGLAPAPSSP